MIMMMPQPTTTTTTSAAAEEEEEKVRTLRIGDLEPWMFENYIYLCFEHTGEVLTSKIIRDEKTGKSECFGFIQFETHAIADTILHKFNGAPMPMVIGSLFTLNWAVSDIFTTTSDTHYQKEKEKEEEEEEGAKVVVTDINDVCTCCSPFPAIPESTAQDGNYQEAFMKFRRATAAFARRLIAMEARQAAATNKNTVGGGAPQEPQTVVPQTVVDVTQRVHQIAGYIKALGSRDVKTLEDLLDELKGYVKSIDVAKELHSIDGLSDLLMKLTFEDVELYTGFRAKVAELVIAMVHNNPRGQQIVMEVDGLRLLFHSFISGFDATARTNAFYAISSLIWNNKPGITEFRRLNGYVELRDALLSSVSVAFQRKALNLIQHLLHENSSDCNIVTESGFPSIIMYLACSDDAEVREAALGCLLELTRVEEGGNSSQLIKNNDKLKRVLKVLRIMAPEDLGVVRKERQLVDSLWNACYNEPFSPRAPQLFERPLRAWAAAEVLPIETLLVKRRRS